MWRVATVVGISRQDSLLTRQVIVWLTEVEVAVAGETVQITVTADIKNTDNLYIGNTWLTTSDGDFLFPWQSVTLDNFKDTTPIYLISWTAAQNASILSILK